LYPDFDARQCFVYQLGTKYPGLCAGWNGFRARNPPKEITGLKISKNLLINGRLDEPVWRLAKPATSYDPNHDRGWNWQPDYVQNVAFYFPGTLAETQNVKKFFYSHPNIAGAQSYHNNGGMFLRPPGAEEDQMYVPQSDIAVYDYCRV